MRKYHKKRLEFRQMDELIGYSKGIIADGVVNQKEAENFLNWFQVSEMRSVENPLVDDLFDCLANALEDGVLDDEESRELFETLVAFVGESPEEGEVVKSSSPLDVPPPTVIFEGRQFMFTGKYIQATRAEHQDAVEARLGISVKGNAVTLKVDYLVIGPYATETWLHEAFGRKIKRAVELREKRGRPAIISEQHFVQSLSDVSAFGTN